MDKDFNDFQNFYGNNNYGIDSAFNPIMQYEQAFSYYKYLSMQMDYKIKCKQYEKLCNEKSAS